MDDILTEFITRTRADAALAHDLLEAAEWNLDKAVGMYCGFMSTSPVQPEDQITPDMYSTPQQQQQHSDEPDAPAEEREEGNDTLEALEGSFESRKDLLRRKRDVRTARGLSFLAEDVVDKFHKVAVSKYRVSSQEQTVIDDQFFRHSFMYPDFSALAQDLQEFIASDLLDVSIKTSLEKSNRLNWWTNTGKFPRLEPLATSGDGNCLLHAASLYMWGFHDRFLILRTSMHRLLTQSREQAGIQSRWRYQTQLRNNEAGGLTFSEEEWEFEWSEVVRIATNRPRCEQSAASLLRKSSLRLSYEYLEEIHIFALAHVTQRPIIVIADTTLKGVSGEDLAPIYFGGVYLPLEMNPTACHKSPVVLAYDAAHFSALVAKEEKPRTGAPLKHVKLPHGRADRKREEPVIPLVSPDGNLLPIQFVYDPAHPTVKEKWGKMKYAVGEFPPELIVLLESYLNIRWVKLSVHKRPPSPAGDSGSRSATDQDYDHLSPANETTTILRCPAAHLAQESQPVYQKELIDKYLENVQGRFKEEREWQKRVAEEREDRRKLEEEARLRIPVPCQGVGCEMFGTASTNNLCSVCYHRSVSNDGEIEKEDLAVQARELDSDTVELYMPRIDSECPPSYREAVGTNGDGEEEGEGEGEAERGGGNLANGVVASEPSVTLTNAPRKELPKPPPKPGRLDDKQPEGVGRSSSVTSVSSSTDEANGGDKSPKKSKSWVKKLQSFPGGLRPGAKAKKSSTGYSRDNIQPIGFGKTPSDPSAAGSTSVSGRTQCCNVGCEFFGDPKCEGYCSTCYKAILSTKSPTTVV